MPRTHKTYKKSTLAKRSVNMDNRDDYDQHEIAQATTVADADFGDNRDDDDDGMAIDGGDGRALHQACTRRKLQIIDLPNEILHAILSHVPCVERNLVVNRVCRRWHDAVKGVLDRDETQCATRLVAVFRRYKATVCGSAAHKGHFGCLVRAVARGFPVDKRVTEAAARVGSLACLRYLHSMGCPWDESAARAAARSGSLACLRYLYENGCPWDDRVTEDAASKGHLDCLRYAHEKGCVLSYDAAAYAAQRGQAACLDYILTANAGRSPLRIGGARGAACIRVMERFGLVTADTKRRWVVDAAAGDPEGLAYLLAHGAEPTLEACQCAVSSGTLDTLRLLVGAGRAWDAHLCAYAARHGRLAVLTFLRAHGYEWDARTCAAAVTAYSLDCLRYAHENGCPWDERAWSAVHAYTDADMVVYLTEHDCPRPHDALDFVPRTAAGAISA